MVLGVALLLQKVIISAKMECAVQIASVFVKNACVSHLTFSHGRLWFLLEGYHPEK